MAAPKSPTNLKTSRNIALEKGANPSGFEGAVTVPAEPEYKDDAEAARPTTTDGRSPAGPSPFANIK